MKKAWKMCFAALVAILPTVASAQSTNPRPLQRATDEHLALLLSRQYDKLDKSADAARRQWLKTSDGQLLLSAIQDAASGSIDQFTDELWKIRKERLLEWAKRNPSSITARLALAAYPLHYGWFARGTGRASTVNEEGWRRLNEGAKESHAALMALDDEVRADPRWYEEMLYLAITQGWPRARFDALYDQATKQFPQDLSFYFSAVQYLSPRWYGSEEEQRRAIEQITERTRPQMGEVMYARLNWAVAEPRMVIQHKVDWGRMKAGFERLTTEYPDPWNVNNYARFACFAGDIPTLQRLLATIGENPIEEAWMDDLSLHRRCKAYAAGLIER